MYFVVSWDISAGDHSWAEMDKRLQACFAQYKSVRPVYTVYFVKVSTKEEYETIFKALYQIAENSNKPEVHFVMSPLLTETDWRGWTNGPYWDQMRKIMA